jgi:hypothetical protein
VHEFLPNIPSWRDLVIPGGTNNVNGQVFAGKATFALSCILVQSMVKDCIQARACLRKEMGRSWQILLRQPALLGVCILLGKANLEILIPAGGALSKQWIIVGTCFLVIWVCCKTIIELFGVLLLKSTNGNRLDKLTAELAAMMPSPHVFIVMFLGATPAVLASWTANASVIFRQFVLVHFTVSAYTGEIDEVSYYINNIFINRLNIPCRHHPFYECFMCPCLTNQHLFMQQPAAVSSTTTSVILICVAKELEQLSFLLVLFKVLLLAVAITIPHPFALRASRQVV